MGKIGIEIEPKRRPRRPLLAYDRECRLCSTLARWGRRLCRRVEFRPNQAARANYPEIPVNLFEESIVFIAPTGEVSTGALAGLQALSHGGPLRRLPLWLYRHLPGFSRLSEAVYDIIARRCRSGRCGRRD